MKALDFLDRIVEEMVVRGAANSWDTSLLASRIIEYLRTPVYPSQQVTPVVIDENSLDLVSNNQLILEMLKRGFAVMRVPENGKPSTLEDVQ